MPGAQPSRRTMLSAAAGAAVAAVLGRGMRASASTPRDDQVSGHDQVVEQLSALEQQYSARLGVFARHTGTGRVVSYRADERFPMCSVFKALAAGAVLRDLDHDGEFLAERIHYTEHDVAGAGEYTPITGRPENLDRGMTVEQLCAAAVSNSDNAAANLLLRQLGGPTAVTKFCRSIGDVVTRLDRYEPELNSAEPWRVADTTSPLAVGETFENMIIGGALAPHESDRLTTWLVANTTNGERFGAGLPTDWTLADKTGGGDQYGIANDVGVVWPPGRTPIVLSVLSTKYNPNGPTEDPLIARTAELLATALT
ncbi:class A beta-lactamase [Mycolicibacillus parakoreensis]|nr:class A beta-lactamase [Mycolicibacillus parakoreensis]